MKCDHVQDLLSSYIDGMTGEKENESIRMHLDNCEKCQLELRALEAMQQMLLDLPMPAVPDNFMSDFHNRLSQEHNRLIDFQRDNLSTIRKPKWVGWTAATAAAVALAFGIYMSSYIPAGMDRVAQNTPETTAPAPNVNDIINNINGSQDSTITPNPDNTLIPENNPANGDESEPWSANPPSNDNSGNDIANSEPFTPDQVAEAENNPETPAPSTVESEEAAPPQEYIVHHMYSSTSVADVGSSIAQVATIAEQHGVPYNIISGDESQMVIVASGNPGQSVVIETSPEQAEEIVNSLSQVGISPPVYANNDYTEDYNEISGNLANVEESIAALENNPNPTPEDQAQLQDLQANQQELQHQQEEIINDSNTVTIEINFTDTSGNNE